MLPSSLPLLCVQVFGAFAKLSKAIISFVMSVRLLVPPSVRPHGITQLPLEGFYISLFFRKFVDKFRVSLKSEKNNGYFTWGPMYMCDNISLNSSYYEKYFRQN